MKIQPLSDKVLVEREKAPDKIGNIIIPDSAQAQVNRGIVQAVGSDVKCDLLKVGTHILFGHYSGNEVEVDGKKVLMLAEEDILAVVYN